MKKFFAGLTVGLILMLSVTVYAAMELNVIPNPFPVLVDGVQTVVEGYNINGYTFLKLADFKKAGLTVKFNETDKQIEITSAATSTAAPMMQQNDISGGNNMVTNNAGWTKLEEYQQEFGELPFVQSTNEGTIFSVRTVKNLYSFKYTNGTWFVKVVKEY